jgi:hypothetical protein
MGFDVIVSRAPALIGRIMYSWGQLGVLFSGCLIVCTVGCAKPHRTILFERLSPDGRLLARVAELSIAEDATVGSRYEITLASTRTLPKSADRDKRIWESYKIEPVDLVWATPETLGVVLDMTEYGQYAWSVKSSQALGVNITLIKLFHGDAEQRARLRHGK